MSRQRRGFTLIEMSIVLAVMAIAATLVAPALVGLGQQQARRSEDQLMALLRDSRKHGGLTVWSRRRIERVACVKEGTKLLIGSERGPRK